MFTVHFAFARIALIDKGPKAANTGRQSTRRQTHHMPLPVLWLQISIIVPIFNHLSSFLFYRPILFMLPFFRNHTVNNQVLRIPLWEITYVNLEWSALHVISQWRAFYHNVARCVSLDLHYPFYSVLLQYCPSSAFDYSEIC